MTNEDTYKAIIIRLLRGWRINHKQSMIVPEWYHPFKPHNNIESMTDEEFELAQQMEREAIDYNFD